MWYLCSNDAKLHTFFMAKLARAWGNVFSRRSFGAHVIGSFLYVISL